MARRTTGHLHKRGGVWWLRYQLHGRRINESLDTGNKEEAEKIQRDRMAPLGAATYEARVRAIATRLEDAGQNILKVPDAIPLSELWTRFPYDHTVSARKRMSRELSPRSVAHHQAICKGFVSSSPKQYIHEVTVIDAHDYSKKLKTTVTPKTHNYHMEVMQVIFRLAGVKTNPFAGVQLLEEKPAPRECLEEEDIRKVMNTATGEMRILLMTMLYTGLRLGDAVNLEWDRHVHWKERTISRITGKTKDVVSFPILPPLQKALEAIQDKSGLLCPALSAVYTRDQSGVSKRVRQHLQSCELVTAGEKTGRKRRSNVQGAHSFRHTFITFCARAGVPVSAVQAWVGHHSAMVTQIYQHWRPQDFTKLFAGAIPDVNKQPKR